MDLAARACGLSAGCPTVSCRKQMAGAISTRSEHQRPMATVAKSTTAANTALASLSVPVTSATACTAGTETNVRSIAQGVGVL